MHEHDLLAHRTLGAAIFHVADIVRAHDAGDDEKLARAIDDARAFAEREAPELYAYAMNLLDGKCR